jgi:hypothetical protein
MRLAIVNNQCRSVGYNPMNQTIDTPKKDLDFYDFQLTAPVALCFGYTPCTYVGEVAA